MSRNSRTLKPPGSQLVVPALAAVFAIASIMGRLDRSAPADRFERVHKLTPPDSVFVSGNISPSLPSDPCVLDLVTGSIGRWPRLDPSRLQVTALSPWVDAAGRRQIVGRQVVESGACLEVMLARYQLPEARLLDRLSLESPPLSPPCWDPRGAARILFVGLDRNLYRVDFADGSSPTSVSRITWEVLGHPFGDRTPLEICWFRGDDSRDYLIAAVAAARTEPKRRSHLWWLRLDAGRRAIDDAGSLIEPSDPEWYQESRPAVSTGAGRRPLLAFLANRIRGERLDVFTAEIQTNPDSGCPRIRREETRLVAQGCAQWPPVFSPDGRHLYCLRSWENSLRFTRHEVAFDVPSFP